MKHLNKAALRLCLLLLGLIAQRALAQGRINDATLGSPVCPGRTYLYSVSTDASSSGCSFNWTINGGQIVGGAGSALVQVVWNNLPTGPGNPTSLQVSVTGCTISASSRVYGPLSVFVRSLSQTAIGSISVSGDVSFGSTTPVTLSIPQVAVPSNGAPVLASGYYWIIPQGWQYADGQVSDGSSPVLINNGNGNSITVTPAAGTGGTVTVRAADTSCGFNGPTSTVSSQSLPASTAITRSLPTVRLVSNRTPTGGNLPLTCGDGGDFQWRAELVGAPAGGSLNGYTWNVSGVAQSFCCLGTAAPGIYVTGRPGTGSISLQTTYCRSGACTQVPVTPVTVTVGTQVATPTVGGLPQPMGAVQVLCGPTTVTASAPGATDYVWEATGGLLVNGSS